MMKRNLITLAVIATLSACGGSSSNSELEVEVSEYSVKAIDGYLRNAQVWLDLNGDYLLDDNEPSTTSGEGGVAVLDVTGIESPEQYSVVVKAIAGETIDEDSITDINVNGETIDTAYIMSAPAGQTDITPLSTLVKIKMDNGATQEEAVTEVAEDLAIDEEQVLSDYIEDEEGDVAAKATAIVELEVLPESEEEMAEVSEDDTALDAALEDDLEVVKDLTEDQRVVKDENGDVTVIETGDSDGDGVTDDLDIFPNDPTESADTDGDQVGDNADAFPNDPTETIDSDEDGVGDNADAFPNDRTETTDSDEDGVGDNADAFPDNPEETTDTDLDGVGDNEDAFPEDATKSVNTPATFSGSFTATTTKDYTGNNNGSITVTDVDTDEDTVQVQTDVPTSYGSFSITETGSWTYVLDATNASVDSLDGSDDTIIDTITVMSADSTTTQISITIMGVNIVDDTPVVEDPVEWTGPATLDEFSFTNGSYVNSGSASDVVSTLSVSGSDDVTMTNVSGSNGNAAEAIHLDQSSGNGYFKYSGTAGSGLDQITGSFTLETVIQMTSHNTVSDVSIFEFADTTNNFGFKTYIESSDAGSVKFKIYGNAQNTEVKTSDENFFLAENTWYHIVSVFNETASANGTISIYINGVLIKSRELDFVPDENAFSDQATFGGSSTSSPKNLTGAIDNVATWNQALTDAEIAERAEFFGMSVDDEEEFVAIPEPTGTITLPSATGIDLEDWYLSIPVDNGEGEATSVGKNGNLGELSYPDYFYGIDEEDGDKGLVMICPSRGPTTSSGTYYSRVELREMLSRGSNTSTSNIDNNWVFGSAPQSAQDAAPGVDGELTVTMAVNQVTTTYGVNLTQAKDSDVTKALEEGQVNGVYERFDYQLGRVVIGQIHASSDEPIRLYYRKLPSHNKGSIYYWHEPAGEDENGEDLPEVLVELIGESDLDDTDSEPENGIALNEKFSYTITVTGNNLDVTITRDDESTVVAPTFDMSNSNFDTAEEWHYFKVGLYHLNNTASDEDYVKATFYEITNTHDGYADDE